MHPRIHLVLNLVMVLWPLKANSSACGLPELNHSKNDTYKGRVWPGKATVVLLGHREQLWAGRATLLGPGLAPGIEKFVQPLVGDSAHFTRNLAYGPAGSMCLLGDRCRF